MIGIYFSGTGNTQYCVRRFFEFYRADPKMYSIEDSLSVGKIKESDEILFAYPIQFSSLPKIVFDYIVSNATIWKGKRIFILSTMGLFSGDGSGLSARLFAKYGAMIVGGVHLKMPDSVADVKALKRPLEENRRIVAEAMTKLEEATEKLKAGSPPREGLGFIPRLCGFFGQRLYFGHKTKKYSNKLKIDHDKCIGCGKCTSICPMKNIVFRNKQAYPNDKCTMCYRCISRCPNKAITLLGKNVIEQSYMWISSHFNCQAIPM